MSKVLKQTFVSIVTLCVIVSLIFITVDLTSNENSTRAAGSSGSFSPVENTFKKYANKEANQLKSEFRKLKKDELIKELNAISETNDEGLLIPIASALEERKSEFSNGELIKFIKDKENKSLSKNVIVDIYYSKNFEQNSPNKTLSDTDIYNLISDKAIEDEIRAKIIGKGKFQNADLPILKQILETEEGIAAFHSLKQISNISPTEAYELSQELLDNKDNISKEKQAAALKATAKYLKANKKNKIKNYKELQSKFIAQSKEVLAVESDMALKDTAVFSLSDIRSKEAFVEVLNNPNIDTELKIFAVNQNYSLLKEMLGTNISESDMAVVIKAMEILPLKDLETELNSYKGKLINQQFNERLDSVLLNIKTNGHNVNKKWIDGE